MSEKRHFKLFSSMHVKGDKNNYVRLFDAIEKQEEYDEKALIKTEKYISNFSDLKMRVYDSILKSLRVYYANQSSIKKLKAEIDYIEILLRKGLLEQAKKRLQKVKKKAEEYEYGSILLDIFDLEMKIMNAEFYQNNSIADIDKKFGKFRETLNQQLVLANNRLFATITFASLRKLGIPNDVKSERQFKNSVMPYYIKNEKGLNYLALLQNYKAKGVFNTVTNNFEQAFVFNVKLIKLMERHPYYIHNNPREYAIGIYNYVHSHVLLRRYSPDIFMYINKLRSIDFDTEFEKTRFLMNTYLLEMSIHCFRGEFEKNIALIGTVRKLKLIQLDKTSNPNEVINISLQYFIAYTYFGLCDYKQSGKYLNYIINYNSPLTIGYIRSAKILRLIMEFEMEESDLLEYSIRSTYRYLFKKQNMSKLETHLLKFLKNQLKNRLINKELIESFKELKTTLEKLQDDRFERQSLNDFDYISWLESKIEKRSFADIVREKHLRNNYDKQR